MFDDSAGLCGTIASLLVSVYDYDDDDDGDDVYHNRATITVTEDCGLVFFMSALIKHRDEQKENRSVTLNIPHNPQSWPKQRNTLFQKV